VAWFPRLVDRLLGSRYAVVRLGEEEREAVAAGRDAREVLTARALRVPVGEVDLREAKLLVELVGGLRTDGPIVEIGTLFGWSTRVLALAKEPERRLVTVDRYVWNPLGLSPEAHERATRAVLDEAVRELGVEVVAADKADFYAGWSGPAPSLVFLDAVHTYEETAADLEWARSVGAEVVCGHDYGAPWPGVVRAVDERGGPARLVGTLFVLGESA
jgi:predicted O-methyltransferase YrrM